MVEIDEIKVYENGKEFIEDNDSFLRLNPYMSTFFYLDSGLLTESTEKNYAVKIENDKSRLIGIKVEPYNLLLYGDSKQVFKLLEFLDDFNYEYDGILCPTEIGDEIIRVSSGSNKEYYLSIGMDFMECDTYYEPSSPAVISARMSDLDEIFELTKKMFKECRLTDIPVKDKIKSRIDSFRVIKENGKIISMAGMSKGTDNSYRITHVYTRVECRGMGYAEKVVNTIKNEILDMGYIATLNVDMSNPISNHIYKKIGFKKVFSQGIYLVK